MKLKFEHNKHREVPLDAGDENAAMLRRVVTAMEAWGAAGEFGSYAISFNPQHRDLGYSASFKGSDGRTMRVGQFKTLKAAMRKLQKLETSQAAMSM